jgi:uncharacterized protein DUF2877
VTITLRAHQIGATAFDAMLESNASWSVLASVSGAIYIESGGGEILWIAASSSALHPRAMLLSTMPTELPADGVECVLEDGCLHVGGNLVIGLREAERWPITVRERANRCVSTAETARKILAAIHQIAVRSPAQGLFATVRPLLDAPSESRISRNEVEQAFFATASRGIDSLCQITTESDLLGRLQDAVELVGLGQGLTPSGDDLLGGFLYTHRVLDSSDWRSLISDSSGVDEWLQQARRLTNKISFSILADYLRGDAGLPLHEFLNAALEEQPIEDLTPAARRVSAIGHSSGWDLLAGVACSCAAIMRVADDDPAREHPPIIGVGVREMGQEHEHLREVVHVW